MTTNRAKEIFVGAIKLAPEDRGAYLDEHCGDDADLRADVELGELLDTYRPHDFIISDISFSPDGKRLISGSHDDTIRIWEPVSIGDLQSRRQRSINRALELEPLVDAWVQRADGNSTRVLSALDNEILDGRTSEEVTTLRNLVLQKLVEHRQANSNTTAEPAAP